MGVIHKDGFDWYLIADITKKWTGYQGTTLSLIASPSHGGQLLQTTGTGTGTLPNAILYKAFGTNYTQGLLAFTFNANGNGTASKILAVVGDGTSEQISVRTNASSILTVTRNGTLLATGTTVLGATTDYRVELKFSIHASAGTVLMHLNGASEALTYATGTSTTQNTRATANTQFNSYGPGIAQAGYQYDDIVLLDTPPVLAVSDPLVVSPTTSGKPLTQRTMS